MPTEPPSLSLRELVRLKAQAAQALTAENMVEVLDSTSVWFEKVADLFTKADATVEAAIAAGSCRWFDAQRLKLVLSLFSSLHQYLMTAVPGWRAR